MSCYVMDQEKIAQLVNYLHNHEKVAPSKTPQETGDILLGENVRSVMYRYPEDKPEDMPGRCDEAGKPYTHRDTEILTPPEVEELCGEYYYQACECPDYEESKACNIIKVIRSLVALDMPRHNEKMEGERKRAEAELQEKIRQAPETMEFYGVPFKVENTGYSLSVSRTDTAKLIRKLLKKAYPGVKFSVRSESYAGGGAIRIGWTDGPCTDLVDRLVGKLESTHFNGMDDSTSYTDCDVNGLPVHFCSGYITTNRELSDESDGFIAQKMYAEYGEKPTD